jgi:geranylgeranyl diphosphate synthase, type II
MAKSAATREAPSQAEITAPGREVEAYLETFLAARPMPANLREAIAYSLLGDGKRLRPVLAIQSCLAVGGKKAAAMPAAAAIEMIHCFSLIHDDLPAMDDDDLRRGRPTLHKHTSEPMAVLAGDCLQSLAVELLTTKVADPTLAVTLVRELSVATNEMIAGQVYDTLPAFDDDVEAMDRLITTHEHKTGALLRAACRMGAASGGANASQLAALTSYAEAIGLMFQVVDDLLDVTQTAEEMGKATKKDEDKGKLTYPGLLGIEASKEEVDRLRREAIAALSELGDAADPLRALCEFMAVRKK